MRLIPNFRGRAALAALAILATASFAQTVDNKPKVKAQILDDVTALLSRQAYVPGLDFSKWKEFAEAEKDKLDSSKDDNEFSYAVNEALTKFGASHIYFQTPKNVQTMETHSMVGIGITQQPTEDGTLVLRTIKGAPADKAGLVPGDLIVKVDGQKAEGAKGIAGAEGTKLVLTVKKVATGKTQDVTLVRSKFDTARPEELIPVDKTTARLLIPSFYDYNPERVESLMKQAAKYSNLIVDLRDNGGGAVEYMQHFLGLLLPSDEGIGTFVTRRVAEDYADKTGGSVKDVVKVAEWSRDSDRWSVNPKVTVKPYENRDVPVYKGHLAVLVNRFSGSASEITAAALRDLGNAEVVGTKSAGAVLVSVIGHISNGFTLQYPIADYVTTKGLRIEGNGIVPAVEVQDLKIALPTTPDPVVLKAADDLEKIAKTPGVKV